jgi:hypothetical protein
LFTMTQRHPGTELSLRREGSKTTAVVRGPSSREYEASHEEAAVAICRVFRPL